MEFCWIHNGVLVKDVNSKDFNLKLITNRMLKNKKARKVLVVLVAIALVTLNTTVVKAQGVGLDRLDVLGNKLLYMAQKMGKWVFLVIAIFNVIKDGVQGGSRDNALKTIVKYLAFYAALYALPWLFDLIDSF